MSFFRKIIPVVVAYLFIAPAINKCFAQETNPNTDKNTEYEADTIVVEDSALPDKRQVGDTFFETESSSHTVIKKEKFENKIADISNVLAQYSPVQVRRMGGLGSFASFTLRGSSGARLPVYLDGMLLSSGASGLADLNGISTDQIERIEVFKGNAPMSLAQPSIAGAINIVTKRNIRKKMHIATGTGSFNTFKLNGNYTNNHKHWNYSLSASHVQSKNNYTYTFTNGTTHYTGDDYNTTRHHNAYNNDSILLKVQRSLSDGRKLHLSFNGYQQDKQLPTWLNNADSSLDLNETAINTLIKYDTSNSESGDSAISAGIRYQDQIFNDPNAEISLTKEHVKYVTQYRFVNLYFEKYWKNTIFTTNSQISDESFDPHYYTQYNDYAHSVRYVASQSIQSKSFFFSDKLTITPSLRYYINKSHRKASEIFSEQTQSNHLLNSQLGIQYNFTQHWILTSNISNNHRVPTFNELFSNLGITKGNPDLKPENARNFDISLSANKNFSKRLIKSIGATLTYYLSDIDDAIIWTYNSQHVGFADNTAKSHIDGIELSMHIDGKRIVSWNSDLTLEDARLTNSNPLFNNKRIPGHAFLNSHNQLSFRIRKSLQLTVSYNALVGRYYDYVNDLPVPDQTRLNTTINWANKNWRYTLEMLNLLNQKQEDYFLNPLPGRSIFFTIQYQK